MLKKPHLLAFILLVSFSIHAQERISTTINSSWQFLKGDTTKASEQNKWSTIAIPHTWNAKDVFDEEPGYYRGVGWYKKTIFIPANWQDKEVYLQFDGVGQVAEVYLNGKLVGKHTGGYTAFSFPINTSINFVEGANSANQLVVKVDNSHNENIPPLAADFTYFAVFTGMFT